MLLIDWQCTLLIYITNKKETQTNQHPWLWCVLQLIENYRDEFFKRTSRNSTPRTHVISVGIAAPAMTCGVNVNRSRLSAAVAHPSYAERISSPTDHPTPDATYTHSITIVLCAYSVVQTYSVIVGTRRAIRAYCSQRGLWKRRLGTACIPRTISFSRSHTHTDVWVYAQNALCVIWFTVYLYVYIHNRFVCGIRSRIRQGWPSRMHTVASHTDEYDTIHQKPKMLKTSLCVRTNFNKK